MTAFGSPTGAVPVGGSGQFDGVMLLGFTRPRIEGTFTGDRMRAWDTDWGHGTAKVVIENSYAIVSESVITDGDVRDQGRRHVLARVSAPRQRRGDQRAGPHHAAAARGSAPRVRARRLSGRRTRLRRVPPVRQVPDPVRLRPARRSTAAPRTARRSRPRPRRCASKGSGVRLDALDIHKSTGGVTGAAWVGWDGNYSFNADGTRIPVESLTTAAFPRAPLSGLLQFTATGTGTFDVPRYDVRLRVDDLFAGDEGIGQLTGRLSLRGELLTDGARSRVAAPRDVRARAASR